MKIAIVEDIDKERSDLKRIILDYAVTNNLNFDIQGFGSGEDFLESYRPLQYTLIFLDIYLQGMSGIKMAEQIRLVDQDVLIIFMTTSEEHRADAFYYHAYDYIPKSAGRERIYRCLDSVLRRRTQMEGRRFTFTDKRKEHSLKLSDIAYLQTHGNYIIIRDREGNAWRARMTFTSVKETLQDEKCFLVILRGVMVNMDYITDIRDGICYLKGGVQLPVNVRQADDIINTWQNYLFAQVRNQSIDMQL